MAMSRAVAAPAAISWVTKLVRFSVAACERLVHAGLVDHAVLNQALRQAAQAAAGRADG